MRMIIAVWFVMTGLVSRHSGRAVAGITWGSCACQRFAALCRGCRGSHSPPLLQSLSPCRALPHTPAVPCRAWRTWWTRSTGMALPGRSSSPAAAVSNLMRGSARPLASRSGLQVGGALPLAGGEAAAVARLVFAPSYLSSHATTTQTPNLAYCCAVVFFCMVLCYIGIWWWQLWRVLKDHEQLPWHKYR